MESSGLSDPRRRERPGCRDSNSATRAPSDGSCTGYALSFPSISEPMSAAPLVFAAAPRFGSQTILCSGKTARSRGDVLALNRLWPCPT